MCLLHGPKKGDEIKRLVKYWIKDEQLAGQPIAIYGNQYFTFVGGIIKDLALYEGGIALAEGYKFLQAFIDTNRHNLLAVIIIDIAYSNQTGWFIGI